MFKSPSNVITILQALLLVFSLYPETYVQVVIATFLLCLARLVIKIGNGSFFLELLHAYAAFTCLLMPLVGYKFYNDISLAILWVRTMPVPPEEYFAFNIPAVISMGLGFFAFRVKSPDDRPVIKNIIDHIKVDVLAVRPPVIITLTISSLIAYAISGLLPTALAQLNTFLYYSLFAGGLYIYFYKDFPWKWYFIAGIVGFILLDALKSGMFTIIAYMSGLILILVIADKKISLYKKMSMLVAGLLALSFIQLFKLDLRRAYKRKQDASITELATKIVSNSQQTDFEVFMYPIYQRMNQGYNIALVQKRIPRHVDYLGGEYLGLTFLSSFVPRIVWPDKPEAGGRVNMEIYTGLIIRNWSTNVGPMGEAYGNFGYFGGWVYVFAFSFFIRAAYTKFISISRARPIFFLWLPAVFFQTFYVIETDSLQAFNSLIKGTVFMFIMYKLFPVLFPKRQI